MSTPSNADSNIYREAATEFIRQVRQHSSAAADCVEQIQGRYGTRAAYLAAFALIQLKRIQVERKHVPSQQDVYAFTYCEEMGAIAEAMQLYEDAAGHLLSA